MYVELDNNTRTPNNFDSGASNGSVFELECKYGWIYEEADIETTITMEVCFILHD